MDISQFDFIDFGASKGGAIDFGVAQLGGKFGVGVDIDSKKIAIMKTQGYSCMLGDITDLKHIPDNSFRFCTMSHVLEHLPDEETVFKAVKEAARVSSDFLFFRGPFFDEDDWLAERGFKLYWSDWKGHPYHLTTRVFEESITRLGLSKPQVYGRLPIFDSVNSSIHPLQSPIDSLDYDPSIHPPKKHKRLQRVLYKEIVSMVPLREANDLPVMNNIFKNAIPLEKSRERSILPSVVGSVRSRGKMFVKSFLR